MRLVISVVSRSPHACPEFRRAVDVPQTAGLAGVGCANSRRWAAPFQWLRGGRWLGCSGPVAVSSCKSQGVAAGRSPRVALATERFHVPEPAVTSFRGCKVARSSRRGVPGSRNRSRASLSRSKQRQVSSFKLQEVAVGRASLSLQLETCNLKLSSSLLEFFNSTLLRQSSLWSPPSSQVILKITPTGLL